MTKPEPSEVATILADKIEMIYADEYRTDHRDEIARLCNLALHWAYLEGRQQGFKVRNTAGEEAIQQRERAEKAEAEVERLLNVVKLAYRKHVLGHDEIGWGELEGRLHDELCNAMGSDAVIAWTAEMGDE